MMEYRSAHFPGHTLEAFGAHYERGTWWDNTGGYVGHADWRDEHGQGSRSYCGPRHGHSTEQAALECIKKRYEVK